MKQFGFGKKLKLTDNSEFRSVIGHRQRFSNSILTVYVARNGFTYPRLGVSIGRAAGSAVVRNRIKRLLREAFRLHREQLPAGYDIVVMAGKAIREHLNFKMIEASLLKLVGQAGSKLS